MFNWKIIDIQAKDGLITQAKYYVTLTKDGKSVETEGHWKFGDPVLSVPFEQVTEEIVVGWIQQEAVQYGKNIIESCLMEQLEALKTPKVLPPWVPQVFTLGNK
jgi:hypothetical protein